MECFDVYFLALVEPYESRRHPVGINAIIVPAATLLHPSVRQPDGGNIFRCLTAFPGRYPGAVVPLSTITYELGGGRHWRRIGDWASVVEDLVDVIANQHGCDDLEMHVPGIEKSLLANGPETNVRSYLPDRVIYYELRERSELIGRLEDHVRSQAAEAPLWPGDNLVTPPPYPPLDVYEPATRAALGPIANGP